MRLLERVSVLAVFSVVLLQSEALFAWGPGHDHVNRLGLTILPAEIRDQLPDDVKEKVVRLSHVPDDFTPWDKWSEQGLTIAPADMKLLNAYKVKHPYALHSAKGQAANLILLSNAFKDKSPERIALWMACLFHTHADEAAANHDPLLHYMHYAFKGGYKIKLGKGIGLDFANIAREEDSQAIIQALLDSAEPTVLSDQADEALVNVMMSGLADNAYLTRRGSTIAASYAQNPSNKTLEEARKALAELGVYGAARAADSIVTAWHFAQMNADLELTEEIESEYAKRKAEYLKHRPLADDSLFTELLKAETRERPAIGVLVEPSISMNKGKLAFSSKLLSASIMRTFLHAGTPFRFVDIRDLESKPLPSPEEMPLLVVCAGKFYVSEPGRKHLTAYLEAGGKVTWIGGEHKNMLGKLSECLEKADGDRLPVSLKYGKQSPIWETVRFRFDKNLSQDLAENEYGFTRSPNTKAGWQVPKCPYVIKATDDSDIVILASMRVDQQQTPIAGALLDSKGKAQIVFLPEYLVAPYVLSDEDSIADPARPKLDKVGREIMMSSVELLSSSNPW